MYGWTRVSNSTEASLSPTQRAWLRFRHNRLGFYSLVLFVFFFGLSVLAEVLCNDKPLLARYNGSLGENWYPAKVVGLWQDIWYVRP